VRTGLGTKNRTFNVFAGSQFMAGRSKVSWWRGVCTSSCYRGVAPATQRLATLPNGQQRPAAGGHRLEKQTASMRFEQLLSEAPCSGVFKVSIRFGGPGPIHSPGFRRADRRWGSRHCRVQLHRSRDRCADQTGLHNVRSRGSGCPSQFGSQTALDRLSVRPRFRCGATPSEGRIDCGFSRFLG